MEFKNADIQFKSVSDSGEFQGLAAVYETSITAETASSAAPSPQSSRERRRSRFYGITIAASRWACRN